MTSLVTASWSKQVLEPVIAAYAPDLVIVSAGFDAVVGDPLGGMNLSPELFGHLTERMARLAKGKLVLVLEGGYNLRMTAECARQCMQVRARASHISVVSFVSCWPWWLCESRKNLSNSLAVSSLADVSTQARVAW